MEILQANSLIKLVKASIITLKAVAPYRHPQQLNFKLSPYQAWKDWGEGNYLEPDLKYGRQYIEATRSVLDALEES